MSLVKVAQTCVVKVYVLRIMTKDVPLSLEFVGLQVVISFRICSTMEIGYIIIR